MTHDTKIHRVLREQLDDPDSSFSIGSFGAIAEFHRDADEPLILDDPEQLTIATDRGALRIELIESITPVAYETLSRRSGCWQHGVVFCCPKSLAQSHCRSLITELGLDHDAIRTMDRDAILFDMGLSARNVDFCIRTGDPELLTLLRQDAGRSVLEPESRVMDAIVESSPHRIAISRLGRAEVYQAIDKVKTPQGPHTHVLPKFLKCGRTHPANIPVPRGTLPCLSLYPANPLFDGLGRDKPFDTSSLVSFQSLLKLWGVPEYCAEKTRAMDALRSGLYADAYDCPRTRLGRIALRVTLRQLHQADADNPTLDGWSNRFDSAATESDGDRNED
jgi:hypothetical protein